MYISPYVLKKYFISGENRTHTIRMNSSQTKTLCSRQGWMVLGEGDIKKFRQILTLSPHAGNRANKKVFSLGKPS